MGIQFDLVFVQVGKEILRTQDLGNFDQLVIIIGTMEEWIFSKDLKKKKEMTI
jgi:hypothetical protein